MTQPAGAAPADRSGGHSYKAVYLAFFGLLLGAFVVAVVMYFKLLHYERVALLHLPEDSTVAARVDVENVVLFEPVRKHLLPLANSLGAADPKLKPRLKRLEQHTRIEFAVDLREIAVARGSGPGDWVVIFGGLFPKQNVVLGLRQVLAEEGVQAELSPHGRVLTLPSGVALGQAEDGCILVAASASRLESALPRQDTVERLLLPRDGAGGAALSGNFARALADATFMAPMAELRAIHRLRAELRPGQPLEISARIELRSKDNPADTERSIDAVVRALEAAARASGIDHAGEIRLLERARIAVTGPGLAEVVAPWDQADIERAAESLARALTRWVEGPKGQG